MNKTLSIKVCPFLSNISWKFYNLNTIIGCRFSSQAYKILGEWFYDDPSSDATPRCHVSTKILRKRMPIKENLHYTLWSNIRNFIRNFIRKFIRKFIREFIRKFTQNQNIYGSVQSNTNFMIFEQVLLCFNQYIEESDSNRG